MLPIPIVIDVAIGASGKRMDFRYERMARLSDDDMHDALAELQAVAVRWFGPKSSTEADSPPQVESTSVVAPDATLVVDTEGVGGAVVPDVPPTPPVKRKRKTLSAVEPPTPQPAQPTMNLLAPSRRRPFDPDEARERASQAI